MELVDVYVELLKQLCASIKAKLSAKTEALRVVNLEGPVRYLCTDENRCALQWSISSLQRSTACRYRRSLLNVLKDRFLCVKS